MFGCELSSGIFGRWFHTCIRMRSRLQNRVHERTLLFQINPDIEFPTAPGEVKMSHPAGDSSSGIPEPRRNLQRIRAIVEVLLVVLFFGLFSGQLPPDVNESHYLAKAKHFWNPDWCPGDLFLGSAFSHWFFYLTTGWLTKWMSLSAFAWTGRILTWTLLAIAWNRLSRALVPKFGFSFLSATLFVLLNDRFHLAGEWVVGGFESKGIAYALVLLAIEQMIRGNWWRVWPLAGAASAFHILVGGWAVLVLVLCAPIPGLLIPRSERETDSDAPGNNKIGWRKAKLAIGLSIGAACFLIGAVPPLMTDLQTSADIGMRASELYVHSRISHHFVVRKFSVDFCCSIRGDHDRLGRSRPAADSISPLVESSTVLHRESADFAGRAGVERRC